MAYFGRRTAVASDTERIGRIAAWQAVEMLEVDSERSAASVAGEGSAEGAGTMRAAVGMSTAIVDGRRWVVSAASAERIELEAVIAVVVVQTRS